ncbi:MAG: peptidoglycan-binding domain-containing protein [Patescibacteria group bacterium]
MKQYKSLLVVLALAFFMATQRVVASDPLMNNLYFGLRGNSEVVSLQAFLAKIGVYTGPQNGNFYTLTREAVKKYQQANSIIQATGYVGPITRASINNKLKSYDVSSMPGNDKSIQTQALQLQIDALTKQLAALQLVTTQIATTTTSIQEPTPATTTILSEVVATSTQNIATTTPTQPNPFDSNIQIQNIYPSLTLSSYGYKTLAEFKITASEKVAITKLRLKNDGTFSNANILDLELIDSQNSRIIAKAEQWVNGIVEFSIVENTNLPNKGLIVSGGIYSINAFLTTPNYGDIKPYIRLDIEKAFDISAFDYNNLSRIANLKNISFPIEGPKISAY